MAWGNIPTKHFRHYTQTRDIRTSLARQMAPQTTAEVEYRTLTLLAIARGNARLELRAYTLVSVHLGFAQRSVLPASALPLLAQENA
jgi:hypothetical protein